MAQPSAKVTKLLILFIFGVFIIKSLSGSVFFESKNYKGKGYFVRIPEGWSKVKKKKGVVYPQGVDLVQFVPKGINLELERPEVSISIHSKKLATPIWIEDEFPDIVLSLREAGFEIKDDGEIKIDNRVSSWVVYYDRENSLLNLEFYIVSNNNIFFKIQYSADPEQFQKNRNSFEELKNSFRFRFSLY